MLVRLPFLTLSSITISNSSNRSNSFLFLTSSCMTTTIQVLDRVTPSKVSLEGSRIQWTRQPWIKPRQSWMN
eukprot:scaffold1755_cov61-Cylindrotheca_fusiformis.AAC.2